MRLAQVRDEVGRALPEVSVRPFEAEQLRELRARQVERQPRFEADEDGFGKESDRIAGANEPCRNRDEGHEQRRARGKRGVARGISATQFAHRRDNEQRQCGGGRDDRVLRAAEDPEDQSRKEAGVETRLGWKARQRRVANPSREEVRGERETGHKIRPQPFAPIVAQPAKSGYRRRRGTRVHEGLLRQAVSTGSGKLRRMKSGTFTPCVASEHGACHRFERARRRVSSDRWAVRQPVDDFSGIPDVVQDVRLLTSRINTST